MDVLEMYPVFGNEPRHCHQDPESTAYVAEAVYLWKKGQLTADAEDYWAKGFPIEDLPDPQLLLATHATFRGPHIDGEPSCPIVVTLLSGQKLWLFFRENGALKRAIIRRGWKLGDLADYLTVSC